MSLGLLIYYIKKLKIIFKNELEVVLICSFYIPTRLIAGLKNLELTLDKIKIII